MTAASLANAVPEVRASTAARAAPPAVPAVVGARKCPLQLALWWASASAMSASRPEWPGKIQRGRAVTSARNGTLVWARTFPAMSAERARIWVTSAISCAPHQAATALACAILAGIASRGALSKVGRYGKMKCAPKRVTFNRTQMLPCLRLICGWRKGGVEKGRASAAPPLPDKPPVQGSLSGSHYNSSRVGERHTCPPGFA